MPEIRRTEIYTYPEELKEKTPDKAIITFEEYEVSDEELAEETRAERMANILAEIDDLKARIEKLEKI